MPKIKTSAVDVKVGERLKIRRSELGLSQKDLADMLDISFQQVQKYERGMNKVSSSKLYSISKVLKTSIGYFFDGENDNVEYTYPSQSIETAWLAEDQASYTNDEKEQALELLKAFRSLKSEAERQKLIQIAQDLANQSKKAV